MWITVAMNLIPILVGYLCASHMTKRKIRDLEEIQAAFPVILKTLRISRKTRPDISASFSNVGRVLSRL